MKGYSLQDLLQEVGRYKLKGDWEGEVKGVAIDSRKVVKHGVFIAIDGSMSDGHAYVNDALEAGAVIVICEKWPEHIRDKVAYVRVQNSRNVAGKISAAFYGNPSEKMKVVGVTGTNGKTTVATLLYNLFKEMGYSVGLISTIEILVNEKKLSASLTTPDVVSLHETLALMIDAEVSHVFMEVSSHAVDQDRISGVDFDGGVFTNITRDHLDYHKTFKSYISAKQKFFSSLSKSAFALVNVDDKNGEVMVQNAQCAIFRYSFRELTDYKGKFLNSDSFALDLEFNRMRFISSMTGKFNGYNLLAVFAVAHLLEEWDPNHVIERISGLRGARGRMEVVAEEPKIIVDYAHTPDALENVCAALSSGKNEGRIIVVVGCGGDRDKGKRPLMSIAGLKYAHQLILTSDNPRGEDPTAIINDMKKGLSKLELRKCLEIVDRETAIKTAIAIATKKDTILIAGKGHEQYQEINGERFFFSDQQIVKDILSKDI